PVARQAHNLKAAGSNPAPATKPKAPTTEMSRGFLAFNDAALNRQSDRPEAPDLPPKFGRVRHIEVVTPVF
ncbi:hypothetical protein, partial [Pararhizobium sp. YC-54]|uniref:hypothetical protein n=1 Tax=Pararhizobium sp. YC-54 TaxID=2986920 RepID=UPI0021F6DF54